MKLVWDSTGDRLYQTGVDRVVLYNQANDGTYPKGVAWNGITGVSQSPEGGDANDFYADNMKYLSLMGKETFGATITAYTYPDEWEICDGSAELVPGVKLGQQTRKPFGLCYRTLLGNDVEGDDYGYVIHIIYNAKTAPSSSDYATVNDSPEPIEFSWDINTTEISVDGFKPTSYLEINSTKVSSEALTALEAILYGDDTNDARLPLPAEIKSIFENASPAIETSISLDKTTATVGINDTITLVATVSPSGTAVSWSSNDTDIATVTNGVVTGVSAGEATITASITVGTETKNATCSVTVESGEG